MRTLPSIIAAIVEINTNEPPARRYTSPKIRSWMGVAFLGPFLLLVVIVPKTERRRCLIRVLIIAVLQAKKGIFKRGISLYVFHFACYNKLSLFDYRYLVAKLFGNVKHVR